MEATIACDGNRVGFLEAKSGISITACRSAACLQAKQKQAPFLRQAASSAGSRRQIVLCFAFQKQ